MNYHVLKIIMDQIVTSTANHVITKTDTIAVINLVNVYVFMDGLETIAKFVSDEIHYCLIPSSNENNLIYFS